MFWRTIFFLHSRNSPYCFGIYSIPVYLIGENRFSDLIFWFHCSTSFKESKKCPSIETRRASAFGESPRQLRLVDNVAKNSFMLQVVEDQEESRIISPYELHQISSIATEQEVAQCANGNAPMLSLNSLAKSSFTACASAVTQVTSKLQESPCQREIEIRESPCELKTQSVLTDSWSRNTSPYTPLSTPAHSSPTDHITSLCSISRSSITPLANPLELISVNSLMSDHSRWWVRIFVNPCLHSFDRCCIHDDNNIVAPFMQTKQQKYLQNNGN